MTGLRTIWGVSIDHVENEFGGEKVKYLLENAERHIKQDLLQVADRILKPTAKGKFLIDGIASDLFVVN
jgi:oxygen-independent coproporphyrinogen-3 oxidase